MDCIGTLEIPIDCWLEIFGFCDPLSLAHMRMTCKFFRETIKKYCYKWDNSPNGGFRVNGKPWGLQKGYPIRWITDTWTVADFPGVQTIYYQGKLKITYQKIEGIRELEGGFHITSIFNENLIYEENNMMGIITKTYITNDSYETDQYYYITGKLVIFSIRKDGVIAYSARKGLIFSVHLEDKAVIFNEEISNKLKHSVKTQENLKTEILSKIQREAGTIRLRQMEFVLRKKEFLPYL